MAQKRTAKSKRSRKKNPPESRLKRWAKALFFLFLKLSLVGLVLGGIGLIYLDAQIREQFEGKRWALPAKVYARPLDLYAGQMLTPDDLKIELQGLGYQVVRKTTRAGQASFAKNSVDLYTRGFEFSDASEPSKRLKLNFSNGSINRVTDGRGREVALARLEPILIGGIYPQNNEDRDLIRLSEAPLSLSNALIAVEDRNYYSHFGISPKGIARAMWVNIKAGKFVQGGSTLTQQLIKNFYLTSDRTLARKLMEMPMAVLLDFHYSKEEILEAYLNEVYLGQEGNRAIHGFGLGAQYFFAQPLRELQLHQVALLAGMVKGPSYYDPRRNPERAKKRRDLVLKVLLNEGHISNAEYQDAIAQPLGVVKQKSLLKGAYPAYLDLVKRQLRENYREEDLRSEGLRVFTGLNPISQRKAELAMVEGISKLEKRYGKSAKDLQGSMVVTDPQTGEILAIVGGKRVRYQGFNRALDSVRPVGSLIKPAVYLAALEQGYTLVTPLQDEALRLEQPGGQFWEPNNFDKKEHGQVPLHTALSRSYNLSTAHLGLDIGLDSVIQTLQKLGMQREMDPYPSLLLGAQGMPVIEVAGLYQTIAANGFQIPLRAIRMVTDSLGNELSRYPYEVRQTVSPESMHLLQYALHEVTREGTARSIHAQLPSLNAAGKTGTSNDQRDSWFAGFTGNRLAVIWLGKDDNSPLPFTGSGGALKVWVDLMKKEKPESYSAPAPEGVEYLWIDQETGYLSDERCLGAVPVPFLKGTKPEYRVDCGADPVQNTPAANPLDWFRRWFRQE